MSCARLHVAVPQPVADFLDGGSLRAGFEAIARLAGAELDLQRCDEVGNAAPALPGPAAVAVRQGDQTVGRVACDSDAPESPEAQAAAAMASLLEHMVHREAAVADLASALLGTYDELNLLYRVLPAIATRTDEREIGELLVNEAARVLNSRRVSLLGLNEQGQRFTVLASLGLPPEARHATIPVAGSVAGQVIGDNDLLLVDDIAACPELAARSRGQYDSRAFAVVRVPLRARGQAIGVLTVTERMGAAEFTARDRKVLEALSAVGASALMNCRLRAAINRQIMGTIQALASAVDAKDHYTHSHSRRVADLALATARELGWHQLESRGTGPRDIELGGLLHDIGKIGIPDHVLSKTARLTTEEYAIIKTHAQIGAGIVARVDGLQRVAELIRHHHERYDGLGYPAGLAGDEIPIGAALISVADCFDSLTSDRPYSRAVSPPQALVELRRCRSTQFNPAVVDAFISAIEKDSGSQW